jgi:hypothetical protein
LVGARSHSVCLSVYLSVFLSLYVSLYNITLTEDVMFGRCQGLFTVPDFILFVSLSICLSFSLFLCLYMYFTLTEDVVLGRGQGLFAVPDLIGGAKLLHFGEERQVTE